VSTSSYFTPATFSFLKDLSKNNRRDWFERNRSRYEEGVKDPAVRFITDFGPHLRKISTNFRADPRPVGGSLFRIHRDVRFAKDKSPYKTHTGIHFRHFDAGDAHAPGFYLHIEPGEVFVGVGIWHPDTPALEKIRMRVVEEAAEWKRVTRGKGFASRFELSGESLSRPPRGFAPDHPLIEDLKRKDFIGVARLTERDLTSDAFLKDFASLCRAGGPLNRFICGALGIPY
jgi:uncharacterized protein (TIGR02453 family)